MKNKKLVANPPRRNKKRTNLFRIAQCPMYTGGISFLLCVAENPNCFCSVGTKEKTAGKVKAKRIRPTKKKVPVKTKNKRK